MRTPDFSMILAVRLFNEASPEKFKTYYNILLCVINNSFGTPFKTQIEKKYISQQKLPVNVIPKKVCTYTEMRYCEISKEMSSLYFGLAVFCLFQARVPEFEKHPPPPPRTVYMFCILSCIPNTASNYDITIKTCGSFPCLIYV